jgi:hypothetical protein
VHLLPYVAGCMVVSQITLRDPSGTTAAASGTRPTRSQVTDAARRTDSRRHITRPSTNKSAVWRFALPSRAQTRLDPPQFVA